MLFIKTIIHTLAFLLEIVMLIALGYYGFHSGMGMVWHYVLAIALPLTVVVIWSIWAAPKSARRIAFPYRVFFALSLFLLTAFLLYQTGQSTWSFIFAGVAIFNALLTLLFERKFISE